MPKIVDYNGRKKLIAKATWNIISTEGLQGVSVRSIAKEANLSLGAVRHYFNTQEELIEYALTLVEEQVNERINTIIFQPISPKEMVLKILMELVHTGDKKVEMQVWLEYILYRIRKKDLKNDKVYEGITDVIYKLNAAGLLKENLSIEEEIVHLHALVDGLALHILMGLVQLDEKGIEKLIERELNRLFK